MGAAEFKTTGDYYAKRKKEKKTQDGDA